MYLTTERPLSSVVSVQQKCLWAVIWGRKCLPFLPHLHQIGPGCLTWSWRTQIRRKCRSFFAFVFDRQHRATPLPTLSPGEPVWIKEPVEVEAEVARPVGPRSYAVRTPSGLLIRNRTHLNRRRSTPPSHPRFNPAVPSTLPGPVEDNFQMDLDPSPVKPQATTTQCASLLPPTPSAATSHPEQTTRSGRVVKAPQKLDL